MSRNVLLLGEAQKPLSIWAVYDHPLDMPQFFVARRWEVTGASYRHTEDIRYDTDLEAIRDEFRAMGLTRLKEGGADPVVIESWI